MGDPLKTNFDHTYISLCSSLGTELRYGSGFQETRAVLRSTGKRARAVSVLGASFDLDMQDGFPLLTTKYVNYSAVLSELLWFISGSTNERDLSSKGVKIWAPWAGPDGELGPVYGAGWRRYEGKNKTVDQLACAVEGIKQVVADPSASVARRLIVSSWDPTRLDEMALPPCHLLFQFFVRGPRLDLLVYQRSADFFIGLPYNVPSYATLLHLVSSLVGLEPGRLLYRIGDMHLYENHSEPVRQQLARSPLPPPMLEVKKREFSGLESFTPDDFILHNYQHHDPIHAEVSVLCLRGTSSS